jgi:hypothetical protein
MSRERGSAVTWRLGTCAVEALQSFGSTVQLRGHGRSAERPRSGERSERVQTASDGTVVISQQWIGGRA